MTTTAEVGIAPRDERPPRTRRWRRWLFVVLGLIVVVGLLALVKGAQIGSLIAFGKKAQKAGPPPETVNTAIASSQTWDETLQSVGSVAAARGVSISNDAAGIVSRILFESGAAVTQGQVLVELDTRVEKAQLASARARRVLAATNAKRSQDLFASGSLSPAQRDADESALASASADERALEEQIERKIVRAPFAGKLGIRLVNVGQYLAPGTPITDLQSTEATYVDFSLPQQDLSRVTVGMPVRMMLGADGGAPIEGAVFAIDPSIDPTTRNVRLRATVPPADTRLRPGMFVDVAVVQSNKANVVAIPQSAVVRAPYGDSVFVVENGEGGKIVRQQFVKLGASRGDFVAIQGGVKEGEEIVVGGAFKLRNKARVNVTKEAEPHPELAPRPPNR